MVGRILDACERVLIDQGYDGASTNRIAARAGISPGSLYQYFPDKDAIVLAVLDRYSDAVTSRVTGQLPGRFDQPAPVVVRTTLAILLDALDAHPALLRAVVEHTPRLGDDGRLRTFERRVADLVVAYLTSHRDTLRADASPETAAWFLVCVVEHLTVRYVLDRPVVARDEFLDELTHLILSYIGAA